MFSKSYTLEKYNKHINRTKNYWGNRLSGFGTIDSFLKAVPGVSVEIFFRSVISRKQWKYTSECLHAPAVGPTQFNLTE